MEFDSNSLIKSNQTTNGPGLVDDSLNKPAATGQVWLQQILTNQGDIDVAAALNQLPLEGVRIEPAKSPRDDTPLEIRGTAYLSPIVTGPVPVRNFNRAALLDNTLTSNQVTVSSTSLANSSSKESKNKASGSKANSSRSQANSKSVSRPVSQHNSTRTVKSSQASSLAVSQANSRSPSASHSAKASSVTTASATVSAAAQRLASYSARSNNEFYIPVEPQIPNLPGAIKINSRAGSAVSRSTANSVATTTSSPTSSRQPSRTGSQARLVASRTGSQLSSVANLSPSRNPDLPSGSANQSAVSTRLNPVNQSSRPNAVNRPNPVNQALAPLPRELALSPRQISPEEEERRLISVNNQIETLIAENPRIKLIHPNTINIVGLRPREDYLNKMIRRVKVTRWQRKNRRWFYLACVVVELWLSKVLGVDVSSFLEEQLDDREEYDAIIYEMGEEMVPYRDGQKSSPVYRLIYNSTVSLIIVGVLNFAISWARSYLPVNSDMVKSGKDVLKRLIKDEDELFSDDGTLKKIVEVVSEVKNGNYWNIFSDPNLRPIFTQMMGMAGMAQAAPTQPNPAQPNPPPVNSAGNWTGTNINTGYTTPLTPSSNPLTPGSTPVRYYM